MPAQSLMIQGTGSHVGKSVLVAALCRIFAQDGYRVAPFKAQNMALNSYVTADGLEMGRAQAVQAEAAKTAPSALMNPILIKPTTDTSAQVIVMGKPVGNYSAQEYGQHRDEWFTVVQAAYTQLAKEYEFIIIEGAGSPAEINLRDRDFVNMDVAAMADAPVLLVGDIDKGGVFAWFIGTLQLLSKNERDRVRGFLINKFRGDRDLLNPGIDFLERETQKRVFGVIPYFHDIRIQEEDSLRERTNRAWSGTISDLVKIAIIELPHMSNFTDFDPLEAEPDVLLRYVRRPEELRDIDALIIPGTKNTIGDLEYLYRSGFAYRIQALAVQGKTIVGICGGYQMMGCSIADPYCVESSRQRIQGLGLLDVVTTLVHDKITSQVEATCSFNGVRVRGYEIHHGRTVSQNRIAPAFSDVVRASDKSACRHSELMDGAWANEGKIWGTSIHGLFENRQFRRAIIDALRKEKGLTLRSDVADVWQPDREYDKLADRVRRSLDMNGIREILKEKPHFLIG